MSQVLLPESLVGDPNGPLYLELRKLLNTRFNQLEAIVSESSQKINAAIDKEFADDAVREQKLVEKDGIIADLRSALENSQTSGKARIAELEQVIESAATRLAENDLKDEAPAEGEVAEGEAPAADPVAPSAEGEVVVTNPTPVDENGNPIPEAVDSAPVVEADVVNDNGEVVANA